MAAVAAHLMWGVFPIFWRLLSEQNAFEVLSYRVLWAFLFLLGTSPLWFRFERPGLPEDLKLSRLKDLMTNGRLLRTYAVAAGLIAVNWLVFIIAVNSNNVLQSSLGYYINPLLNVFMGVVLLGERLRPVQWIAISSAAVGVATMTMAIGSLPWISLVLACSFACYGFVKKRAPLPAFSGLTMETAVLLTPALACLGWMGAQSGSALQSGDMRLHILLFLGGTITIAPLSLFAFAAQRTPLSLLGILQYIGPTMQFIVGVWLFGEKLQSGKLLGFGFVWFGLALFVWSSVVAERKIVPTVATD